MGCSAMGFPWFSMDHVQLLSIRVFLLCINCLLPRPHLLLGTPKFLFPKGISLVSPHISASAFPFPFPFSLFHFPFSIFPFPPDTSAWFMASSQGGNPAAHPDIPILLGVPSAVCQAKYNQLGLETIENRLFYLNDTWLECAAVHYQCSCTLPAERFIWCEWSDDNQAVYSQTRVENDRKEAGLPLHKPQRAGSLPLCASFCSF